MDFNDFHKWVLKELGIDLHSYKQEQLNRRITSLMVRNRIKDLNEYKKVLTNDEEQKQKFLDFITINVTEFFRNTELFNELENIIKKDMIPNNSRMKIWSAACSIGCEPYSIAMIMQEINPGGKHSIIATDIDSTILKKAKEGIFLESDIKNVKKNMLDKYFVEEEKKFVISKNIKAMVTFKKHDLILDNYEKDFDLIVCRNVVIYFKNDIKNKIFQKFNESLKKGGLLFVGATESIYNYKEYGFEKVSTFIYRKV